MRVLIVDDERNIRESLGRLLALEGIESATAPDGEAGAALLSEEAFDAVVLDLKMPGMGGQGLLEWMRAEGLRTPAVMISALGEIGDAVNALKTGASDYLVKPFDPAELVARLKSLVAARRREDLVEAGARTRPSGGGLLGESRAMRDIRRLVGKVAARDATVLVTGESGTGKEVVARAIHEASPARDEPFVAVNLGALPLELAESELFGYEKGAFTGADDRKPGLFELAGSGILFLDEVGEMPLSLQVKLLRALQERKTRRLGGTRDIPVRARLVAATNRDLKAAVAEGRFREDLFYRLDVVRVEVPPLRERAEDIPLLAGHILGKIAARSGRPAKRLAGEALAALSAYRFPGNVRELENVLERAAILCEGEEILLGELGLPEGGPAQPGARGAPRGGPRGEAGNGGGAGRPGALGRQGGSLESLERDAVAAALEKWGGNRTKAALELGVSRRTILNKIKLYGLEG